MTCHHYEKTNRSQNFYEPYAEPTFIAAQRNHKDLLASKSLQPRRLEKQLTATQFSSRQHCALNQLFTSLVLCNFLRQILLFLRKLVSFLLEEVTLVRLIPSTRCCIAASLTISLSLAPKYLNPNTETISLAVSNVLSSFCLTTANM